MKMKHLFLGGALHTRRGPVVSEHQPHFHNIVTFQRVGDMVPRVPVECEVYVPRKVGVGPRRVIVFVLSGYEEDTDNLLLDYIEHGPRE